MIPERRPVSRRNARLARLAVRRGRSLRNRCGFRSFQILLVPIYGCLPDPPARANHALHHLHVDHRNPTGVRLGSPSCRLISSRVAPTNPAWTSALRNRQTVERSGQSPTASLSTNRTTRGPHCLLECPNHHLGVVSPSAEGETSLARPVTYRFMMQSFTSGLFSPSRPTSMRVGKMHSIGATSQDHVSIMSNPTMTPNARPNCSSLVLGLEQGVRNSKRPSRTIDISKLSMNIDRVQSGSRVEWTTNSCSETLQQLTEDKPFSRRPRTPNRPRDPRLQWYPENTLVSNWAKKS